MWGVGYAEAISVRGDYAVGMIERGWIEHNDVMIKDVPEKGLTGH